MSPDDPRHGEPRGYIAGCRDLCCQRAKGRYEKRRIYDAHNGRPRLLNPVGTQRRIQSLVALGWTYGSIGERVGLSAGGIHKMLDARYPSVTRAVAERVAAAYEDMSMTLPPSGTPLQRRNASYARTVARKRGWVVPLAWDDIDNPDEHPHVSHEGRRSAAEMLAEFAHLRGLGVSEHHAAAQLGVSVRAIEKALERHQKKEDAA